MITYKTEIIKKDEAAEFDSFVISNPKGHFMQVSSWANVKNNWIWRGAVCRDEGGNIKGTIAMLIRKVPALPYSLMYCPRGPVCDLNDRDVFAALLDAARKVGKEHNCYDIKLDTDARADDTVFKTMIKSLGIKLNEVTLGFETVQPRFVFRLEIEGKTEDEVMAFFQAKTRYNIKVAVKNNVTVEIKGPEAAEEFHKIMIETGTRDNFGIRGADYFKRILESLGKNARIYMAYYEGKPIAGSLAIHCGDKVWYLYGASSNEHRNVMPNYLVQWAMIRWAIEEGCRIYDFRGVSGSLDENDPLYGIYRFKKGFNGELTEFVGEMDLILKPFANKMVDFAEKSYKKLRHIKRG